MITCNLCGWHMKKANFSDPKEFEVGMTKIVGWTIELVLLNLHTSFKDEVEQKLSERHCTVYDCYKHPEYLVQVIKELYGNSYKTITEAIKLALRPFGTYAPVKSFFDKICE